MSEIVVLIPVLARPHRAIPVFNSIRRNTSTPHRVVFICSPNDHEELTACTDTGAEVIIASFHPGPGDYARKINLGYSSTHEPYIFTGADDLEFHHGWDTAALSRFTHPGIGVVGTNDLGNPKVLKGQHSTHSLVSRSYADNYGLIDRPGAIYCERYPHEFCDDELVATAKARRAWVFASDSVVEHLHPHWGKAEPDHLYEQAPRRLQQGRRIYNSRRRLWLAEARKAPAPVSVIIATFGDRERWTSIARRAIASVERQTVKVDEILHVHGSSLAEARNQGAETANSPWLCFLDADDELHPRFIGSMIGYFDTSCDIINPAVQFVIDGKPRPPRLFRMKPLENGNYLVIGTLIRKELFHLAGGFDPRWEAWEDWAFWLRVLHLGGKVVQVRASVYRAHWREDGRNNTVPDKEGLRERIKEDFAGWVMSRT